MGVDIYGWSKVRLAEDQTFNADGEPTAGEDAERIYINDDFPDRCTEWPQASVLFVDGLHEHCFARSYGGYNMWREQLAKMAGYELTEYDGPFKQKDKAHAAGAWDKSEGPFWELILFSDCEGVIGTAVCKKLAKDFLQWFLRICKIAGAKLIVSWLLLLLLEESVRVKKLKLDV